MNNNFNELELSDNMKRGLKRMNFAEPTPVQAASITPMLEGHDLLVQAPTGTGKTAAFGIPMIEGIDPNDHHIQALVLCPTRELALQTATVIRSLCTYKEGIRTLAVYGGEPIYKQISGLRRNPHIIVATPGRMIDHIKRKSARCKYIKLLVLDEADRMLDMGFQDEVNTILSKLPATRQTVLFSATISDEIKKLTESYQNNPQMIHIKQDPRESVLIEQFYSQVSSDGKMPLLLNMLEEKNFAQTLIFVNTKIMADALAKDLNGKGYHAEGLHGSLKQSQRDLVMKKYRSGRVNILVATDVAARGIDVDNIDAVINYDIPDEAESYVHRIGRTGRANQTGLAYTFLYPRERRKLQTIMQVTKAKIKPMDSDNEIDFSSDKKNNAKRRTRARSGSSSRRQRVYKRT